MLDIVPFCKSFEIFDINVIWRDDEHLPNIISSKKPIDKGNTTEKIIVRKQNHIEYGKKNIVSVERKHSKHHFGALDLCVCVKNSQIVKHISCNISSIHLWKRVFGRKMLPCTSVLIVILSALSTAYTLCNLELKHFVGVKWPNPNSEA